MNYHGKKVVVTGSTGFIGSALSKALGDAGAIVINVNGDLRRKNELAPFFDHQIDYCFHFGGPSSQILFKRQPMYSADVTVNGFINLAELCQHYGIKLIYPSTGLLSQGKMNEYAKCKSVLEDMAEGIDALGLRIFATYGPGEGHKANFASVPYLFARDMVEGVPPVIYGDGSQSRDFVYISDVVTAILELAEQATEKIIDVGYGVPTSFNAIISELEKVLNYKAEVVRVPKPDNYVEETLADTSVLKRYGVAPLIDFPTGLREVVDELKK